MYANSASRLLRGPARRGVSQLWQPTPLACRATQISQSVATAQPALAVPLQSLAYHASAHLSKPSLAALKELREVSGAPMMECKKALEESDQDLDKALDWLRQHGAAKASSKVAGRETVEGLIGVATTDGNQAMAVVQVASETDFAGRSGRFVQLVQDVTAAVLAQEAATGEALTADVLQTLPSTRGGTVKELLDEAIVAIRENLSVPSATKLVADEPNSLWVPYVHNKVSGTETGTAVAAVLVGPAKSESVIDAEILQTIGKRLAMHIVAAKPLFASIDDVPSEIMQREREILETQIALDAKQKPPEIVERMIAGRLKKFYEQVCLLEQNHMIEELNPKVSKALQAAGVKLHRYIHLAIGSS
jgi:elongation factor Ts